MKLAPYGPHRFDGDEPELWPEGTLSHYLTKVDTLVSELSEQVQLRKVSGCWRRQGGAALAWQVSDLKGVTQRSKAMIACYPGGGARYIRHCDNSCHRGRGSRCNGRRLTAIMYLNPDWRHTDGGELRVYEPFAPAGRPPVADVQPRSDH